MVLCPKLSTHTRCIQQGQWQSSRRGRPSTQSGPSGDGGAITWLKCMVGGEWDFNQWMVQLDKRRQVGHRSDLGVLEDGYNRQLACQLSTLSPIEVSCSIYGALSPPVVAMVFSTSNAYKTECLPSLVLRTFILSLAYQYLLATLYASTLRLSNDGALTYRHHDLKITFTSTLMEPPTSLTSIRRGFCTITSVLSLPSVAGSAPPPRARNRPRIAFCYTRATWMPAMDFLCDWALACNFETYRYFPTPYPHSCHSFPNVHIQFPPSPWLRTSPS